MKRRAAKPESLPVCCFDRCKKPITKGDTSVRISQGLMHDHCHARHMAIVEEMHEVAILEGRHTPSVFYSGKGNVL